MTLEANSKFEYPLSEREVRSLLSTAKKKRYKMGNTYITNTLGITADEQAVIGISAMPTGAAKRGKNQARDERTAAKRKAESRKIMRLHLLGNSTVSIAKRVGRCYNTVKKRIDEYTEKLGELFSQREICMLFRQRAKRFVEEMKKCATPISFFEGHIYYADRSLRSMNQVSVAYIAPQLKYGQKHRRRRDKDAVDVLLNREGRCKK